MDERDRDLLADILDHGKEALQYLEGSTFTAFQRDRQLQLVTQRLMEIIGEAAGHLSENVREEIPYDWKAVRGLRNILSHQYGNIDPSTLYAAATRNLPDLLEKIEILLHEDKADGQTG